MNTKVINMSMPTNLVKRIDKQSRLSGSNRSDFIRQAIRNQLANLEQWQAVSRAARQAYAGPQLTEAQVADLVREARQAS